MRLKQGPQLTYCMNVHPGEGVDDILMALQGDARRIREAVCPDTPFGLGLRLSGQAVAELQDPALLAKLRTVMEAGGFYAFTVNAFPFGAFHGQRVKEQVYLPDWASPERLTYTLQVAEVLAALLPAGMSGSISTVPLGYRFGPQVDRARCVEHLLQVSRELEALEARTGRRIHLGLEPEPDCVLETTAEAVEFFEGLWEQAGSEKESVRQRIGVCLDTCHVAMQFEDPAEAVDQLDAAGVLLSKVQVSAALEVNDFGRNAEALDGFQDGVYLHQVVSRSGRRCRDLPSDSASDLPPDDLYRIHAHVPLHWEGDQGLRTTRDTLTPAFWQRLSGREDLHLEVETYTFSVLPHTVTGLQTLAEDMVSEVRWVQEQLGGVEG